MEWREFLFFKSTLYVNTSLIKHIYNLKTKSRLTKCKLLLYSKIHSKIVYALTLNYLSQIYISKQKIITK